MSGGEGGGTGYWEKDEKEGLKIILKWSKNAFREVQKSKIFSPWTPSSLHPQPFRPPLQYLRGKK